MSTPLRRQIQQVQHKVEAALSSLMAGEDRGFAVDDLRAARDQLKKLEEELYNEALKPTPKCQGTPGAASWQRCEKPPGHPPPCTHDPAPRSS